MAVFFRVLILSSLLTLVACGSGSSGSRSTQDVGEPVAEGGGDDGAAGGDDSDGDDSGGTDDDEAPEEPEETTAVSIVASLGQIVGADVTVSDVDGQPIEGATGVIDNAGGYSFSIASGRVDPMLVTVTGNDSATYFDEAAGAFLPMPAGVSMRAYAPAPRGEIGVTVLTELAAQVVDTLEGAPTADDINAINESIRQTFAPDLADILSAPDLVNEANFTAQTLTNNEGGIYAVTLAALANLAAGDAAPALAILEQLSNDLADGDIDGVGVSGALTGLDYVPENFVSLFANAIQTAASTLADSDLLSLANGISISIDTNILQIVIDAGVGLPQSVADLINQSGGDSGSGDGDGAGDGGAVITGNYDLTVTGEVVTFGVGTAFNLTINNIVAPDPGQTDEITVILEDTLAGFTNISNLTVTIVNNTTDRITFDVSFSANQSGVSVELNLRYDYVPSGGASSGDSSGDGGSGDSTDSGSGSSAEAIAALGEVCLFGGEPMAVNIPESLTGLFNVRYDLINPGGPYAQDELVHFTINENGQGVLNINNQTLLSTPVQCGSSSVEVIWKDSAAGLIYSLSSLTSGFNEINVNTTDRGFLGQFSNPE